jgi:signal transduction histidine kinase
VNAESEDTALPRLLRATCDTLGWEIGLAWMTDDAGSGLRCVASYARPGREQQASFLFAETGRSGRGTARKAWQRGQPVLASGADPGDLAPGGVLGPALLGDLAVPIISGDQVIGVLEFFGHDSPGDAGLRGTVETIAAHFAQFCRRKRTEADAARVKDQFVATVSHELRTPLAAMDGWLHILLDGDPGPLTGEQHRFLTTVKRNSDRLMRLVGDLLLIGQMDAGRFTLDLGTVDVAAVAHDTATLFAGAAAEKDIGVRLDVADSVVVRGDRLRLGQLLANLLSNAIKFTPSGGKVTLRVADEGSACLVEVSDSGVGIPAAEREHLFERFYRASTAAGVSGSGLGLAISKAIAEAHEGSLRIADRSGPGTTFVVEIPAVVPAAAST